MAWLVDVPNRAVPVLDTETGAQLSPILALGRRNSGVLPLNRCVAGRLNPVSVMVSCN